MVSVIFFLEAIKLFLFPIRLDYVLKAPVSGHPRETKKSMRYWSNRAKMALKTKRFQKFKIPIIVFIIC